MARPRRTRTEHPGVTILQASRKSGTKVWLARWTDPDTGRRREQSLDDLSLRTQEARRRWARDLYEAITRRRGEISSGAVPIRGQTTVEAAVERFVAARKPEVRAATVTSYRKAAPKLVKWAASAGIKHTEDLTGRHLIDFRGWLLNQPRLGAAKGGRTGEKVPVAKTRSPAGLNSDLCTIRAMVVEWRRMGLVPRLTSDAIKDGLRRVKTDRRLPPYLSTAKIQLLLASCRRHDAAVHPQAGSDGAMPRHAPIMDFVVFLLLSGCRVGEALALPWSAIDFEADAGRGRITIAATATKTRSERHVDLGVTPLLRSLLLEWKLRSASAEFVFGGAQPLPRHVVDNTKRRLKEEYGAPKFTWQHLRQTTGTFLTNAPGIYGGSSAYQSARRLGHSVVVAERHYVGQVHVDPGVKTLEAAMGIDAADVQGAGRGPASQTATAG